MIKRKSSFFFFFWFWKKKEETGCKIGQRKHNGQLILNGLFSVQSAGPRQVEGG